MCVLRKKLQPLKHEFLFLFRGSSAIVGAPLSFTHHLPPLPRTIDVNSEYGDGIAMYKRKRFLLFNLCECFTFMYVHSPHVFLVPKKVRRKYLDPLEL